MSGVHNFGNKSSLGGGKVDFYPYEIGNSCRFNDDDSATLTIAAADAMDDAKIYTLSFWCKLGNLGAARQIFEGGADINNRTAIAFSSTNKMTWSHVDAGGTTDQMISTMVFRDTTSWYHILLVFDSTEAAATDRNKMYVNGVAQDDWDTDNQPALNKTCDFGGNGLYIGKRLDGANYFDGYLAEMHFIDGTVYATTDFGEFYKGVWRPIQTSGLSYGTAGFYLDMAVAPGTGNGAGTDVSGNGNHFTEANLAANDQVVDTPTENYCVLNVLNKSLSGMTLSDGNLKGTAGAAQDGIKGTYAIPSSGKWYFEVTGNGTGWHGGIANQDFLMDGNPSWNDVDACTFADNTQDIYIENSTKANEFPTGNPGANVVGVCVNMDDLEIYFFNANDTTTTYSFGATAGDTWFPFGTGHSDNGTFNFGQQAFTLSQPAGYLALNTANIAAANNYPVAIMNPTEGFDVITYAGDDGATQAITGLSFQPDLVWIKNRDQADSHYLCDSVRGATKYLSSDGTDIEVTDANDGVKSFDSAGFTVMYNADDIVNAAGENYVAWNWLENPVYGFDIVSYTGTGAAHAESHNLGVTPEFIIVKNRDQADNWAVYHWAALNKTDPETDYGVLDTTAAWADAVTVWNDTAPTSTQFTVGTAHNVNANNEKYIAYLFRSVEGFSKVFTYEGNGNADGPFVHCGFRPRFILIKNADQVDSWFIEDTERSVYNPVDDYLVPDTTAVEDTTGENEIDFLSNGFKIRNTDHTSNANNETYIGIAFAETPGVYSNSR